MIYNNVELFNVEEVKNEGGWIKLYRFPLNTISEMTAKDAALLTTGCEIRFVGEAYITVGAISSMLDRYGRIEVYRGDIYCGSHTFPVGERYTIKLAYATGADRYYDEVSPVWRVVFGHDFRGVLYDIEPMSKIRPPKAEEMPQKRMVAYGSSITHGAATVTYSNAYIRKLAQKLGVDVENKGVGGGCMCENEVAEYLSQKKCDLLFLELGINMIESHTADEFYKKAVNILAKADKSIPTVLVSPYKSSYFVHENAKLRERAIAYEEAVKGLYNEFKRNNLYFVSGLDIVNNLNMLTGDMIHPSMYGHQIMSERMYNKLKNIDI